MIAAHRPHPQSTGVDGSRAVQILVDEPGGGCGSGYQLTERHVLTAGHVVASHRLVRVRLACDERRPIPVDVVHRTHQPDVAVLDLGRSGVRRELAPARFAGIDSGHGTIECEAVGFPGFKLREDPPGGLAPDGLAWEYRESRHVTGVAHLHSNRRERTLEIQVAPPGYGPIPGRSPWEGMSGAGVFCDGYLVGMIERHHPSDGDGCLTASRVDRWHELADPAEFRSLAALIGLPGTDEGLPDAVFAGCLGRARTALANRDHDRVIALLQETPGTSSPEYHYLYALALLRGRRPVQHRSVEVIRTHLGCAASLPEARALHLLVEEDLRGPRGTSGSVDQQQVVRMVAAVPPAAAQEICSAVRVSGSAVWRALYRRGEEGRKETDD